MIRERLKQYFGDRGFKEVNLHTGNMDLFYTSVGESASLVWIISEEARMGMNKEAYNRYYGKIRQSFLDRGFFYINTITLFLTSECKQAADIAEGTAFWVVDEKYGRLVIYENQPEDFCGIRLHLEQFVSFLTAERVKEAERLRQEEEERIRRASYVAGLRQGQAQYQRGQMQYRRPRYMQRQEQPYSSQKRPLVISALIIINFVILCLVNLFGSRLGLEEWLDLGAVSWMDVFDYGEYYRLFTCMFLHSGIDHIVGNMIVLYAAGEILERNIGHIRFAVVYLAGGLAASLTSCYYYYSTHQYVQSIGASGAVFAVVGALVVYLIVNKERALEIGAVRIVLFALYALYSGFANSGTDNAAHVGGLVGGSLVYLLIYCLDKYRENRKNRRFG